MANYEFADLYRDAAFARRLAAGLVGESLADDVWQSAWQVMLERPPRAGSNLRAYLHTVVRRLALRHRRREARRARRESAVAREGLVPSTAEIVGRMEVHRLVVDALLALEEPYRKTLYLLFFEDLSTAEIARREGVPLETVRTRCKRAIVRLRERLERTRGGDREWLRGLAVLAGLDRPGGSIGASTAERPPWLAGAAAAGVLTAGAVLWLSWHARSRGTDLASATATPVATGEEEVVLGAPPGPRLALEREQPVPAGSAAGSLRFFGRVSDPSGSGIPDAEVSVSVFGVWSREPLLSGRTDADGRYSLACSSFSALESRNRNFQIEAWASGHQYSSVWVPIAKVRADGHESDFVLSPGLTLEGRIVDESGTPVATALVLVRHSSGGEETQATTAADHRGIYRWGLEPGAEVLGIESRHNSVGSGCLDESELPRPSPASLDRALRAPDIVLLERHVLRGRAVYPDGSPARGLGVSVLCVRADEQGRFVPVPPAPVRSGLTRARGTSEEDGRFAVVGLAEGPWGCEPGSSSLREDPGRIFPHERVVQAGEEALLVVDQHRLVVDVVSWTGEPVPDVRIAFTTLDPAPGGGWGPRGESRRTVSHPDGRAPFVTRPGDELAVTVLLPGWAEELLLTVPELPYELAQRVELPESPPRGAARVLAMDTERGGALQGCELRLDTGLARIPCGSWRGGPGGLVEGLPCGLFRVTVVPLEGGSADDCLSPRELGEPVEIEAGTTRELAVELQRGGKLAVAFQTEAAPAAETFEHPTTSSDWVLWFPERQEAVLRRAEDPPDCAPFLVLRGASSGARWESEHALPVGRYKLEARFEGFEPLEQWLEIEPCRATEALAQLTALGGGDR